MMSVIEEKWRDILELLCAKYQISSLSYKTWIQPMAIQSLDQDTLYVSSGKPGGIDYLNRKYLEPLKSCIRDLTGVDCEVVFVSSAAEEGAAAPKKTLSPELAHKLEQANLQRKYNFDSFVVGSNNNFAHAAAVAVAEAPGEIYNPLFIHGGVGLGKTHLMHSIARQILENDPSKEVLYVTSEAFTIDLIESIKKGNVGNDMSMENFRNRYRNVDVLLIDDIQFIIGKESTQEEFFHTFNHLHLAGKQIVISSDQPPKNMTTLEERLRTRFEWGLIADIQKPNFETRMAILQKKIELDHYEKYNIPNDVLTYIASNVESNIRELEGCLNSVVAYAVLNRKPHEDIVIDLPLAREALKDIIHQNKVKSITPELIIETVADHFQIDVDEIMSNKRNREIAIPRQIIMYICRKMTDSPLKSIGIAIGGKDHSTVSHGIDKIEQDLKTDEELQNTINVLVKKIKSL